MYAMQKLARIQESCLRVFAGDGSRHALTLHLVRRAHDSALGHVWVRQDGILHLWRRDLVPAALYDVHAGAPHDAPVRGVPFQ